ncbi:gag protease polyprotein [Cucumis melo var. makuwa]|uniref:Gag protease polyprotein n=1 Tax=Cucumis melo var. makuwa TaxID=1194695 RepID=A0A5D3D7F8_CUCMM|nr:gag protease polyprotein [Cucumis melo var. makuwa]
MDIDMIRDSTGSSQPDCLSVPFGYSTDQFFLGVPLGHRRSNFVPTGAHVAHVQERASVVSISAISICVVVVCEKFLLVKLQEKMPPRRGSRRGGGRRGRGAGRTQPEKQPAVQAANPTAPVTQADLVAMEQCYQDMLQDALAPFLTAKQTQAAPVQAQTVPLPAPVGAPPEPVQLSAEAKHLRDFRKYNPKIFDESMDNPTKAQMWLTSIEKIFRGTAWWETAERMLGGDVSKITREQFKESFYAKFFSANVKYAK